MKGKIIQIPRGVAIDFLLPKHYSGRAPQISRAFGWYIDDELKAVCTFGKPVSLNLCNGICGEQYAKHVYELNRLCRVEDFKEPLSAFIGAILRRLSVEDWIIVSYSDTAMHHNGYIYQATNFMYTGQTKARTEIYTGKKKHSRHYTIDDAKNPIRALRTAKNRYVYFCTRNKKLKYAWREALNYQVMPYPKEENQNYVLGQYIKRTLIDTTTGLIFNE